MTCPVNSDLVCSVNFIFDRNFNRSNVSHIAHMAIVFMILFGNVKVIFLLLF